MKNARIVITIVIMTLILIIAFIPIGNNLIASNVSKKLQNTPLPENTVLIDNKSKAGKLIGNGNGMQYLGAILLKSELTELKHWIIIMHSIVKMIGVF